MNTKKISHIGVLVHDADAATKHWTESFGFKKFDDQIVDVEGIRSIFMSIGGTWDEMVIEIMEPLDKTDMTNALARRLGCAALASPTGTACPRPGRATPTTHVWPTWCACPAPCRGCPATCRSRGITECRG